MKAIPRLPKDVSSPLVIEDPDSGLTLQERVIMYKNALYRRENGRLPQLLLPNASPSKPGLLRAKTRSSTNLTFVKESMHGKDGGSPLLRASDLYRLTPAQQTLQPGSYS